MAGNGVVHYFKGLDRFETEGRSVSVAEFNTQTVTAIAPYNFLLTLNLKVSDPVPSFVEQGTVTFGTLYVRDYRIDRIDGDMGRLTINCVEASSLTTPYNVTVDIDLAQVEKRLVNHPLLNNAATQFQIKLWQRTEENMQFSANGAPQSMFSLTDGSPLSAPVPLTNEYAIKYAQMNLIGVDSYSIYLPIVSRTSQYLRLPGVSINRQNMSASGTANPSGVQNIGDFDTPPITVNGFQTGLWFKNGDKFTQNANGSWTRTESWTYTNDLRTQWIYADGAAKEVVGSTNRGRVH